MTIATAAEGQAALRRLTGEQQAIAESLINLDSHLGRRLLDNTAVEGVTRDRRAEVLSGLARLWELHEIHRSVVEAVHAVMARRSRPTRADLREIDELVTGACVTLSDPDASTPPRQVSLDELVAEIHALQGGVREVVTAVDRVWAECGPRVDRGQAMLGEARELVADLGLAADQDRCAAALSQLATRLDAARLGALTDPLRRWVDNTVDLVELDQLITHCEAVLTELREFGALRREAPRRLDLVAGTLAQLHHLSQRIAELRHQVGAKIQGVPGSERPVRPADHLGPPLAMARKLCEHGRWRRLADELPALETTVSAALAQAEVELDRAGLPLRERSELRGRLGAYRAKAAQLGRIEDLDLERRYQRARELLWRSPCDLALAETAVTEYQNAVNATVTHQDGA